MKTHRILTNFPSLAQVFPAWARMGGRLVPTMLSVFGLPAWFKSCALHARGETWTYHVVSLMTDSTKIISVLPPEHFPSTQHNFPRYYRDIPQDIL